MQQLATEKIRANQLENHCASLKFTHETAVSQFTDLARHVAIQSVCHDIHWSTQAPEGFDDFVNTCQSTDDEAPSLKAYKIDYNGEIAVMAEDLSWTRVQAALPPRANCAALHVEQVCEGSALAYVQHPENALVEDMESQLPVVSSSAPSPQSACAFRQRIVGAKPGGCSAGTRLSKSEVDQC
eukprot:750349-Amphidinium_carterae.1